MVTIISGSRRITDFDIIQRAVDASGFTPTKIIEGGQRTRDEDTGHFVGGVDWLAYTWASKHGIPCQTVRAKWRQYGKAAGPLRNREMTRLATHLIAIPDDDSKGTLSMIAEANQFGLEVYVHEELLRLVVM